MLGLLGSVSCAVGVAGCRSKEREPGEGPRRSAPGVAAKAGQGGLPSRGTVLTPEDQRLISDFADLLLPTTGSPSASAAGVPAYVASLIEDVLDEAEQQGVVRGLRSLARQAQAQTGSGFSSLGDEQRAEFVRQAHRKALAPEGQGASDHAPLLAKLHGWVVEGYARSRDGATRTLRYEAVPGAYNGCQSLESLGGRAWATN